MRFKLASLFVALTVVAVVSCWIAILNEYDQRRQSANEFIARFGQLEHSKLGDYLVFSPSSELPMNEWAKLKYLDNGRIVGISFAQTSISDEQLAYIHELEWIQFVDVTETAVTEDGVAALQVALPDCRIEQ